MPFTSKENCMKCASIAPPPALSQAERERMFNAIYARVHRDMKGHIGSTRSMLSHAKFGGGLITAETISDAEARERFAGLRPTR